MRALIPQLSAGAAPAGTLLWDQMTFSSWFPRTRLAGVAFHYGSWDMALGASNGWAPSTETTITGFSGPAEGLQELTLRNLHVSRADVIHILSSSHRMTSLNLESLLVSEQEDEAVTDNDLSDTSPIVDLPCLEKLSLKWLPPSILLPIVRGLNTSTLETLSIAHANADDDPAKTPFPIVSIIAKLIADTRWVTVDLRSTNVILQPHLETTRQYSVELRGEYSVILPWLRLHLMPQITEEYSTELKMSSEGLGDNPSQGVLDNLMRFPEVQSKQAQGSQGRALLHRGYGLAYGI
ncbi:hypothetical protein FRC00_004282 [Tulasnella sp. 408]|nr:hypothetical protein FRC00_004282 [Tulasnella sp. 408]